MTADLQPFLKPGSIASIVWPFRGGVPLPKVQGSYQPVGEITADLQPLLKPGSIASIVLPFRGGAPLPPVQGSYQPVGEMTDS